jgi:hypothetical protein
VHGEDPALKQGRLADPDRLLEPHRHLRGHRAPSFDAAVGAARGVGESLVEQRGDDAAVEDAVPALELFGRGENGPTDAALGVFEANPQAVGIS